jgi:phosphoglycolate phosphatase
MSVKLVIFDLDGTLIDSSVDITNALNYALEPYSLHRLSIEDTTKLVGEGITRLIEKAVGDSSAEVLDSAKKRFLEHYTQHILDHTKDYPGVKETLERLSRFSKAVISNKKEILSRVVLDGLGLLRYFDVIIGSDSAPEKKPSPIPVLKALTDLNVGSADAVMVGDSNYDVDAGKAAGVTTIAVTYGYRPREVIAHADYLIDKIADLIPLIERINSR